MEIIKWVFPLRHSPSTTQHINHISLGLSQDLAGPLTCGICWPGWNQSNGVWALLWWGQPPSLSIFLACACHQTATSQALRSCYLGGGRARSELMGSEVFLPAVQGGFCTSHAVTGSETKETTTTTPTTTADTSSSSSSSSCNIATRSRPLSKEQKQVDEEFKSRPLPALFVFWHPWMLHISCKPQLLQHRARKDSLRLPYIFSILDGSPVSSQITRGL